MTDLKPDEKNQFIRHVVGSIKDMDADGHFTLTEVSKSCLFSYEPRPPTFMEAFGKILVHSLRSRSDAIPETYKDPVARLADWAAENGLHAYEDFQSGNLIITKVVLSAQPGSEGG